jgi:maleate isomerase
MIGWRARLGFLIPPGSPTTETEIIQMTPKGVSVHFTRMVARGTPGSLDGQEERNRSQIAHLDDNIELISMVKPSVIVMAHTATSYTLGRAEEETLIKRIEDSTGIRFITAFGSVVAALKHLGISRVAVGTPYSEASTQQCKINLQAHGFDVVSCARLEGVTNIYDETAERAYQLARMVNTAEAQAIFLSGVGMPTIDALQALETDFGKPAISSASAMMWLALRVAGVNAGVPGYGRLLDQA